MAMKRSMAITNRLVEVAVTTNWASMLGLRVTSFLNPKLKSHQSYNLLQAWAGVNLYL